MKVKLILPILLFVMSFNVTNAQLDSNTKAILYFTEAEKLFNQGDFNNSLQYIDKAENTLNEPVARTLALKIKIHYALGNFVKAKQLIDNYFANYMRDATQDLNDEILSLFVDIEDASEAVVNKYKNAISEGERFYQRKMYNEAIISYRKAFEFMPNDSYATAKVQLATDKLNEQIEFNAYNKAKQSNYIEDYENYVRKYPYGKYASEVKNILEGGYYRFGNESYKAKNYSEAKNYYEKYLNKYPNEKFSAEVKAKLNICYRKLNQNSTAFYMYNYDKINPLGFSMGSLLINQVGLYLNLKMNTEIFTEFDIDGETDNYTSDELSGIYPTGEIKEGNAALSFGLTYKIVYPLWAYVGGGAGYYALYEFYDEHDYNEYFYGSGWLRNSEESGFKIFPEGGVILKISNAVVLKYGVIYNEEIIHQFGFGIQF